MLALGGVLVILATLLAGASGFGLGIVAVPLLLLAGFSLPFIVTAVLLVSLATRTSVMWRFRRSIHPRRVAVLTGSAVPGLFVGALFLRSTDDEALRIIVGVTVALAAAGLAFAERYPPRPRLRGLNAAAGFAGGVLGTSTSLTGIPPALLLARRGIPTKAFLADLATYFVVTSVIGLGVLMLNDHFSRDGAEAFSGGFRALSWRTSWAPPSLSGSRSKRSACSSSDSPSSPDLRQWRQHYDQP